MNNSILSFYKGKKVFITGHTGFKGTWLTQVLLFAGARITGFSLKPPTEPSLFELTSMREQIDSIEGDVCNLDILQKTIKVKSPDIIFHMAAQPLVRYSYADPVSTYQTNVMGTVHILEAVRHVDSIRSLVNVTTDKVYENKEWSWGYREIENLCGFDPYSNSKSCSELVTSSYRNSFFRDENSPAISTARSGNVIGGGDYAMDRIIPDCVRAAQKKENIIIRNPYSTRPYQHVLECLSGYLLLAKKQYEDKSLAGSYNFGPDDASCITTGKLTSLFCTAWGMGILWENTLKPEDKNLHEASFLRLDSTRAKNMLDWRPHWTIDTAVKKTVEWYKSIYYEQKNASSLTEKQIRDYFEEKEC